LIIKTKHFYAVGVSLLNTEFQIVTNCFPHPKHWRYEIRGFHDVEVIDWALGFYAVQYLGTPFSLQKVTNQNSYKPLDDQRATCQGDRISTAFLLLKQVFHYHIKSEHCFHP